MAPEGYETQDEKEDDATTRVPNYCSNHRINDLPEVQPSFPSFYCRLAELQCAVTYNGTTYGSCSPELQLMTKMMKFYQLIVK
ncbi:hypothetical protein GBA52_026855 [Prunus armeniaca]|nr:hypothetical protein GBA52_026855 [Prunus armeniaca]